MQNFRALEALPPDPPNSLPHCEFLAKRLKHNASGKLFPNKLYLPKQMEEDQLDGVELDGLITLISWMESLGTSPKRNDGCDLRP